MVAVGAVALATLAIYPLKHTAPVVSLSVVYLPAVLLVSTYWGLALGLATSLLSAAAFDFVHIAPVGRFTITDSRNWVALGAFMLVAIAAGTIGELARARALEAERRRGEAATNEGAHQKKAHAHETYRDSLSVGPARDAAQKEMTEEAGLRDSAAVEKKGLEKVLREDLVLIAPRSGVVARSMIGWNKRAGGRCPISL